MRNASNADRYVIMIPDFAVREKRVAFLKLTLEVIAQTSTKWIATILWN